MNKLIFFFFLFSFFLKVSYSQPLYGFEHFTENDGLSSNTVGSILQDNLGYLWFGTENGVVRYDGNDFYVLPVVPDDPNFLQAPLTRSLYEDSKGNIWLLNNSKGLYFFSRENDSFSPVIISQNLQGSAFFDLVIDSLDRLWLAGSNSITIFNPSDGSQHQHNNDHDFREGGFVPFPSLTADTKRSSGKMELITVDKVLPRKDES